MSRHPFPSTLLALMLAACGGGADPAADPREPPPADREAATVVHVDDGDSIVVTIDGVEARVRLIGINAPEQGECGAERARQALVDLVEGREVVLESDAEDADRFGRLLRYLWVEEALVNERMAGLGLVLARPFEPNLSRQPVIDAAGHAARDAGRGMWAANACGPAHDVDFEVVSISADPPGRDEEDLNGEYVELVNLGEESVDMTGFVLRDGSSAHRYQFPEGFVAEPGRAFSVVVGCGTNTRTALYWCNDGPVWDNRGDEVLLADPSGNLVLFEPYGARG